MRTQIAGRDPGMQCSSMARCGSLSAAQAAWRAPRPAVRLRARARARRASTSRRRSRSTSRRGGTHDASSCIAGTHTALAPLRAVNHPRFNRACLRASVALVGRGRRRAWVRGMRVRDPDRGSRDECSRMVSMSESLPRARSMAKAPRPAAWSERARRLEGRCARTDRSAAQRARMCAKTAIKVRTTDASSPLPRPNTRPG